MAAAKSAFTAEPATKPPVNPQNLFTFPTGDIEITVTYKGELVTGKVASTALVLASPVWKTFVHPPFPRLADTTIAAGPANENIKTEVKTMPVPTGPKNIISQPSSQYTVPDLDFKDDDAEALLILLRIAHLQFTKVPSRISFNELLNVAILCDQYDCTELVQPWTEGWFAEEFAMAGKGNEKYLWIAWVFNRPTSFKVVAERLLKEVRVKGKYPNQDCISTSDQKLSELMPPGLIGTLLPQTRTLELLPDDL